MFEAVSEVCLTAFNVAAPAVIVAPSSKSPLAKERVRLPAFPEAKIPRLCKVVPEAFSSPKLRYFAI